MKLIPRIKSRPVPTAGRVLLLSSSHQDAAWMDTPDRCAAARDERVITPALDLMAKDPGYRFVLENMFNLMEYLERRPERRPEIRALTEEGRLEWGATFNQPYESLLSGEELVRQVYYGRGWLLRNFPGCDARVALNPDVPGRTLQSAQVLSKAGIPYLVIGRYHEGFHRWSSPDGSTVLAWSPGHYDSAAAQPDAPLPKTAAAIADKIGKSAETYAARNLPRVYPVLVSGDARPPADLGALIAHWNGQQAVKAGSRILAPPPVMEYSSVRGLFEAIERPEAAFPAVAGERPNLWLYIHGPAHHRAIDAHRDAGRILPAAEAFAAILCALDRDFAAYPADRLAAAWLAALYPDHGWGGKGGQITDRVFRKKYEFARDEGRAVLTDALETIASRVRTDRDKGIPVIVFNSLSFDRTGPVVCAAGEGVDGFRLFDGQGRPVLFQVLPPGPDEAPGAARIEFIADNVPGTGYRTWFLAQGGPEMPAPPPGRFDGVILENGFYRLTLAPGGVKSLWDKALDRELLRTDKFLGFEVFTMRSEGSGAGEFGRVQQPGMDGFEKASSSRPAWRIDHEASGPVKTVLVLEAILRGTRIRERLALYHGIRRVDCEVDILDWDGEPYREFRLALPAAAPKGGVAYEVPLGVVEVGRGEIEGTGGRAYGDLVYDEPAAAIRPREVQRFISVSGPGFGLTLSPGVAVCDFQDPTPAPVDYPVLQPVLLASRRSCHAEGNWYLQEGDHRFRFSVTSHPSGRRAAWTAGVGAAVPFEAVVSPVRFGPADLPEEHAFLRVSVENVLVSALKKAEDDDGLVLRLYEIEDLDAGEVEVATSFPLAGADHVNIIELEGRPVPCGPESVKLRVGRCAIETVKLRLPAKPEPAPARESEPEAEPVISGEDGTPPEPEPPESREQEPEEKDADGEGESTPVVPKPETAEPESGS